MRNTNESVPAKSDVGNAPGSGCPLCEQPLRMDKRGSDYFAWCANGPYNVGCSGISGFGETPESAYEEAINDFATL